MSAASHRATTFAQKASRDPQSNGDKLDEPKTAYIPVPDAKGVVDGWAELYPADKWLDPVSYVKFSSTVEECITQSLADGATYIMDERDQDWLSKNNQEARGEGTSAQAAMSTSGTTTRSGTLHRSAKAKGKEPEASQASLITEAEFELVMGVFEKVTNDNTPFLHLVRYPTQPCSTQFNKFINRTRLYPHSRTIRTSLPTHCHHPRSPVLLFLLMFQHPPTSCVWPALYILIGVIAAQNATVTALYLLSM